ncbi:MAG: hypothetical protein VB046_11740, partial [Paludibacter sp.]|nr:hypothetical protein [Paludibacter sp.]
SRKPCLFLLFLLEGWNVLFIALSCYYINILVFGIAKIEVFFYLTKLLMIFPYFVEDLSIFFTNSFIFVD